MSRRDRLCCHKIKREVEHTRKRGCYILSIVSSSPTLACAGRRQQGKATITTTVGCGGGGRNEDVDKHAPRDGGHGGGGGIRAGAFCVGIVDGGG